MGDRLMTICTYDDLEVAARDCEKLRAAGLRAAVAKCLLEDPDQPGVELHDVIVFDHEMEKAQEVLEFFPADPTGPLNPATYRRSLRWWLGVLILLAVGAAALVMRGIFESPIK